MTDPISTTASLVTIGQGASELLKAAKGGPSRVPTDGPPTNGVCELWPVSFNISIRTRTPEVFVWLLLIGYGKVRVRDIKLTRMSLYSGLTLEGIPAVHDFDVGPTSAKQICCHRLLYDSETRALATAPPAVPETANIEIVAHGICRRWWMAREASFVTSSRHITGWIER